MEDRFHDRDYYYAIGEVTVDEVIPIEAKEFMARLRKFFAQVPGLQSAYNRLTNNNLKNIKGLQLVDEERQNVLDELIEVTTDDTTSKEFLSKMREITHDIGLPELTDDQKRSL